jgi:hypothetical protein
MQSWAKEHYLLTETQFKESVPVRESARKYFCLRKTAYEVATKSFGGAEQLSAELKKRYDAAQARYEEKKRAWDLNEPKSGKRPARPTNKPVLVPPSDRSKRTRFWCSFVSSLTQRRVLCVDDSRLYGSHVPRHTSALVGGVWGGTEASVRGFGRGVRPNSHQSCHRSAGYCDRKTATFSSSWKCRTQNGSVRLFGLFCSLIVTAHFSCS